MALVAARASDVRVSLGAGAALLLQVAHPAVAGGVRDFSDFERDPWGRLWRTLDYVNLLVYGEPDVAVRTGQRLRAMHRGIRGVDPQGRRYHALEPTAYAWVHATIGWTLVAAHARFGRPLAQDDADSFHAGWLELGRVIGVREGELPADRMEFDAYVEQTIRERLEPNDVVDALLRMLDGPVAPTPRLPAALWPLLRLPPAQTLRLATVGLVPPTLRERLDLPWRARDEAALSLLGTALRATTPVLPGPLRRTGPTYLRWRREKIAAGDFGGKG